MADAGDAHRASGAAQRDDVAARLDQLINGSSEAASALLVDDDHDQLDLFAVVLESRGCNVHPCHSAKEALEVLASRRVDFVITDLIMPDMDGETFVKKLRENERLRDLPVLVFTAGHNASVFWTSELRDSVMFCGKRDIFEAVSAIPARADAPEGA